VDEEIAERAGTWETVPCPLGKIDAGSKRVFCIKCKADGSIDKYIAPFVTCSFTRVYRSRLFRHPHLSPHKTFSQKPAEVEDFGAYFLATPVARAGVCWKKFMSLCIMHALVFVSYE
jgi:hypothetical protein